MKKYNNLKKLLCLAAAFTVAVSAAGCKKQNTESNSSALSSSAVSAGSDALDPENIDFNTESGTAVKAEELVIKEGKANGVDVSKTRRACLWVSTFSPPQQPPPKP